MKPLLILILAAMVFPLFSQQKPPLTRSPLVHDPEVPESLTLVVSPGGFNKWELSVEHGIYSIIVVNRTGGKPLELQLDRFKDTQIDPPGAPDLIRVASGEYVASRGNFQTTQTLTPGTYKLSVVNNPNWTCTITVR